jgi:hypothetical protein
MKRHRKIKRKRIVREELKYTDSDFKRLMMQFLEDRLKPEKHGFGEIIYNNSVPLLDEWCKSNLKT